MARTDTFAELMAAALGVLASILWLTYSVRMIVHGNSFGWFLSSTWALTLGVWLYRAGRAVYRKYAQGRPSDVH